MPSAAGRPPLIPAGASSITAPGWRVEVVERTGSTNTDVVQRYRRGEDPGYVLAAEEQTGGRGRLGRTWASPPRAGLTFSVLLPAAPAPWVPLFGGLAVATALREVCDVAAVLKWPNDVLIEGRKICGVLAEAAVPVRADGSGRGKRGAVVLGVGLNVTTTAAELPPDRPATSLALAGAAELDRLTILRAILAELRHDHSSAAYRERCSTLGTEVNLALPDGRTVTGVAADVDADGRLVIDGVAYAAGDVVHLR